MRARASGVRGSRGKRPARAGGALALALALACSGAAEPRGARSALLVTLDTTRADALSCYGDARAATPVLDALAAEGVLFEHAHASSPLTLPAHASMLTGLAPPRHGVRLNGELALSGAAGTLAERARAAGLATAAFVSSIALDPAFGLDQGFEVYSVPERPRSARRGLGAERAAPATIDAALAWLAGLGPEQPFFLWVHLHDPHAPYEPPASFAERAPTPYLAEVAAMDHELGRLLAALRASGRAARTFVLVAGDHGEAFGEHGEQEHGLGCYESTLRIPLLARWPESDPRRAPGTRSRELVGSVDVAPTLAEALALAPLEPAEPPAELDPLDGMSFYSAPLPAERGLYFESYHGFHTRGWSPIAGWLDARGKYLHSSEPELYDWRADPEETTDLAAARPEDVARYLAALRRQLEAPALAPREPGSDEPRAALESLGYAGSLAAPGALPDPLAPGTLESPRAGLRRSPR